VLDNAGKPVADDDLPPMLLLPIVAYAERYPALPIFAIVKCLLDVWQDAELAYVDDDWMGSFDRLATRRLDAMEAIELARRRELQRPLREAKWVQLPESRRSPVVIAPSYAAGEASRYG
jgi:hypothetical protein